MFMVTFFFNEEIISVVISVRQILELYSIIKSNKGVSSIRVYYNGIEMDPVGGFQTPL
jgi:hypothetical protein